MNSLQFYVVSRISYLHIARDMSYYEHNPRNVGIVHNGEHKKAIQFLVSQPKNSSQNYLEILTISSSNLSKVSLEKPDVFVSLSDLVSILAPSHAAQVCNSITTQ